jgi:hypothetical protein
MSRKLCVAGIGEWLASINGAEDGYISVGAMRVSCPPMHRSDSEAKRIGRN